MPYNRPSLTEIVKYIIFPNFGKFLNRIEILIERLLNENCRNGGNEYFQHKLVWKVQLYYLLIMIVEKNVFLFDLIKTRITKK